MKALHLTGFPPLFARATPWRLLRGFFPSYGIALMTSILALGLARLTRDATGVFDLSLFLGAVMISAWFGGRSVGLAAALLCTFFWDLFFIPPPGILNISDWNEALELGSFLLSALALTLLTSTLRAYLDRTEADQKHFLTLVDAFHAIIWEAEQRAPDEPVRFTFVNGAATAILGYPADRWINERDFLLHHAKPEDLDLARSLLRSVQPVTTEELRIVSAGGAPVWVQAVVLSIPLRRPHARRIRGIMVDITDRKQAEEAQRLLVEVTAAVGKARDWSEAISLSLKTICAVKDWNVGQAWLAEEPHGELACSPDSFSTADLSGFVRACRELRFAKGSGVLGRAWDKGQPVWISDVSSDPTFLRAPAAKQAGLRSGFFFPLKLGSRTSAVLEFFSREPLATPDRHFLGALERLGSHLNAIFERIQADQERLRWAEHEQAAQRRAGFLADAGAMLDASLDYATTLSNVAHLAITHLADWCVVDILGEDQVIRRLATAHADPAKEEWARQYLQRFPMSADAAFGPGHVIRTGQAELFPDVTEDLLMQASRNPEHLKILQELAPRSAMVIPLRARRRTLGAITFVSTQPGRRYDSEDFFTAQALAERAALAIDNARLYRESQDAIRLREEFLSIASHELKTPLTALHLYLQSTRRTGKVPSELLERLERQGDRLAQLINQLLDVSRITSGQLKLDRSPVDLSDLVRVVVERFRETLDRQKVAIDVEAPRPAVGQWDRARLEQVVTNLLSNAIKYGAGNPIRLRVYEEGETVRLVVEDQGIGMGPEQQKGIFRAFGRAVSPRHYSGLGLGLYIVRQIVEAHGGTIRVKSRPGSGTTFTLMLPRLPKE
jgi:PAS domain S-box-containing protein